MRVQYISYKIEKIENIDCTTIESPQALDAFDINFISLRDEDIWKSKSINKFPLVIENELINLFQMIRNSSKSKIIIVLPQDVKFRYDYKSLSRGNDYSKSIQLKHMLNKEFNICLEKTIMPSCQYYYENNETLINGEIIKSAFWFSNAIDIIPVTKAKDSEKVTTIQMKDRGIFYTFLDLYTEKSIYNFLVHIGIIKLNSTLPEWLEAINYLDDEMLNSQLNENLNKIEQIGIQNKVLEEKIDNNRFYKKMLVTNGDELVKIVFNTFQEILSVDLSSFVDQKNEDFIFKLKGITFIGEIKGVTSNVKNEHIAQVDEHVSRYLDKLEDDNIVEIIKPLLIINHQRNNQLCERQPVNENQIRKAIKNECLIIETSTLLRLLEKYRKKELSQDEIIDLLIGNVGLLSV